MASKVKFTAVMKTTLIYIYIYKYGLRVFIASTLNDTALVWSWGEFKVVFDPP